MFGHVSLVMDETRYRNEKDFRSHTDELGHMIIHPHSQAQCIRMYEKKIQRQDQSEIKTDL